MVRYGRRSRPYDVAAIAAIIVLSTPLAAHAERIVSVGGTVTEIVYALGAGDQIVGVDTSSVHPPEATKLTQLGYQRTLSAEGVLSLKPSLVLLTPDAGPPAAVEQLKSAGLNLVVIPTGPSPDAARASIRAVAKVLKSDAPGEELLAMLDADLARAAAAAKAAPTQPRVLFIYARGAGSAMVSGRGTAADQMIVLAGAQNAVTDYEGFRPLTEEGVVAAAPDIVLVPTRGLDSLGGTAALLAQPGLALTPAAKNQRVVAMDDLYLLGFGPRTGKALVELTQALHAEQTAAGDSAGGDVKP